MKRSLLLSSFVLLLGTSFLFTSCKKDDPVTPTPTETQATQDAAESIAASLGYENGGTVDQFNDLMSLATTGGLKKVSGESSTMMVVDTSYNQTTGEWTLSFIRKNGNPNGLLYAEISREYTVKFLNKNGQPQKFYLVPNLPSGLDTAYSIVFKINSGMGIFRLPRVKHKLTSLSGSWTATGTNTNTITINGSYQRSAIDTISTIAWKRTLTNSLSLNFVNVVVQRGVVPITQRISGNVNGTFDATVLFQLGTSYSENTIHRTFSVTYGNGTGSITISGQSYKAVLATGEIQF